MTSTNKSLIRAVTGIIMGALVVGLPAVAAAQTVGVLSGHVFDQSGTPIRGVKLTATSDTQIGGPKTTYSDDQGGFRLTGLSPGVFTLTAAADRLKTVVQKNVRVVAASTAEIDILMEVETAEEQVRVVEKAPTVDTNKTSVGEIFDQDFVASLPLESRSYQGVMTLAPGVSDVSGSGNPNVRGAAFFNNNYLVDGFSTTDPVTHTFGTNFSFDAQAQQQVLTAGFGAEYADTIGGVTNTVTKSGSNRLEVEATGTYTDQNMQVFKDSRDAGVNRISDLSLSVGGPIQKDRLWYFVSGSVFLQTLTLPLNANFPRHPSQTRYGFDGLAKVNWQISARNKLEMKLSLSPATFNNLIQSYLVEPEAEARQTQFTRAPSILWTSALSDSLALSAGASYLDQFINVGPQSCTWDPNCDTVPGTVDVGSNTSRQNYTAQQRRMSRALEARAAIDWFADSRRFGSHDLRIGFKLTASSLSLANTVPGNFVLLNNGPLPFERRESCSNDPKNDGGDCHHNWIYTEISGTKTLAFISEAWKPTRYLTFTPELAAVTSDSRNDKGLQVTGTFLLAPSFRVSWDPTHDGRTAVRGTVSTRVEPGFLALADQSSRRLFSKLCSWDAQAQAYIRNCTSSGGDGGTTVGLPCGPDGINPDGTSCRTKLRPERVWEATVGVEREVWTGIALGADYIYRHLIHGWEDVETNALWNLGGTDVRREGTWKSGRSQFVFDLETPDLKETRYHSVTAFMRKREGRLQANLSYTWTSSRGTSNSSFESIFLDNPGQTVYYDGPLPDDNRHNLQALVTYLATPWLSLGGRYNFVTGGPYNRYYFNNLYGDFTDLRAQRGTDSRGSLNPDNYVDLRLPDLSLLNVQVRFNLQPLIKQPIDIFADVFNVLALRTTTDVFQQNGQNFGGQAGRLPPLNARIALHYRFR